MSKKLGIIGGMGPKATAVFFDRIVENTVADNDQDHIDTVILNHATLPDRTKIILNNEGERFLEAIAKDLRLMEHAGVSHIAIPCNTSHYFYDEMKKLTSIPIINMVEETMKEIRARCGAGARVGLLATKGTINSGVYKHAAEAYGLQLHIPDTEVQQQVMDIIYNDVKRDANIDPTKLQNVIDDLLQTDQCSSVILACTELSCIPLNDDYKRHTIDAMEVLVRRSIELSGKSFIT